MTRYPGNPCSIALKEWAVICRALETGRQTLFLRKGGIREGAGGFRPEHERFWLYPTQFHQGAEQLAAGFDDLLPSATELRTADDRIVLRSLTVVERVHYLTRLEPALALAGLHGWSAEVIQQRFHYRQPGLHLFMVRAFASAVQHSLVETVTMAGCKSWVDLPAAIETGKLAPVLDEETFARTLSEIDSRLATA